MKIDSEIHVGDMVYFIGSTVEQMNWGYHDDPNKVLLPDDVIKVTGVAIHDSYTSISLFGIKGWYNSVSFKQFYSDKGLGKQQVIKDTLPTAKGLKFKTGDDNESH